MKKATIAALVAVGLLACQKQPEKARATLERITETVYASGVLKSKNQYQVFPAVGGLLQKLLVREGDLVKKGDALFVVQNEVPRLQAENARLAADFAELNASGDRLRDLKAAVETARSKMLNDSVMAVRQRGLWAQGIGSKVELEQRELASTASANAFQSAVFRLNDLQKQLAFAAAQGKKQLSISQNAVGEYTVRSLVDGRVYGFSKEAGEAVGPQTPVAVVGSEADFEVELQVDESDIARVRPGQRVLLTMDSYPNEVFEAAVARIGPLMNERTRTFTVEADFVKKPPAVYPNLTAEANIVIMEKAQALTVPRSFLLGDSLVILENKERRRVEVGLKDYAKAEILGGLTAGQTILKPEK